MGGYYQFLDLCNLRCQEPHMSLLSNMTGSLNPTLLLSVRLGNQGYRLHLSHLYVLNGTQGISAKKVHRSVMASLSVSHRFVSTDVFEHYFVESNIKIVFSTSTNDASRRNECHRSGRSQTRLITYETLKRSCLVPRSAEKQQLTSRSVL